MIRVVKIEDTRQIMEIYRYYIENTVITFEYELPSEDEFRNRIENIIKRYPYLVAEENGEIIGYAYAGPFKTRAAYDWSVETSIYIKKDTRENGCGSRLYDNLEKCLSIQNVISLYACITWPNEQSVAFHEKHGYQKIAHFEKCGYKFGKWQDVIWMEKRIGDLYENPKPVRPFSMIEEQLLDF